MENSGESSIGRVGDVGNEPVGALSLRFLASGGRGDDDEFLTLILDFPGVFDVVESCFVGERDGEGGVGLARDVGNVGRSS